MKNKILVLDDDADTLVLVKDILEAKDYDVKTVKDWKIVFNEMASFQPDLVILDYILKDSNGGEICHQIKSDPGWHNLPVIILTAYSRVLTSLGTYGCDSWIEKPFEIETLTGEVSRHLGKNF